MAEPAREMPRSNIQRPDSSFDYGIRPAAPKYETHRAVERLGAPQPIKDLLAAALYTADVSEEALFQYVSGTGRAGIKQNMMNEIRAISAIRKDIPKELRNNTELAKSFAISYLYRLQQYGEAKGIKPSDKISEAQAKLDAELEAKMALDPLNGVLDQIDPALATMNPKLKSLVAHALDTAAMSREELFAGMDDKQFNELIFRMDGIRAGREGMTMQYQDVNRGLMIQLTKDLLTRRFKGAQYIEETTQAA